MSFTGLNNITVLGVAVAIAASLLSAASAAELSRDDIFRTRIQPLVVTHCLDCHSGAKPEADLNLKPYRSSADVLAGRPVWLKALQKLRSGEMPPKDSDQPSSDDRKLLVAWLDDVLNNIDCTSNPNPGHVTIRRLNRVEYRNTVRDLVGIDYKPAADFPADDVGYGFDNIGDVLSLPPLLMEKYLAAAEEISQRAIVTAAASGPLDQRILGINLNTSSGTAKKGLHGRMLTTSGEMLTEINFPVAGEYELRALAYGDQAGGEPVKMAFLVDGKSEQTIEVKATQSTATAYLHRTTVKAGPHKVALAFLNDYYNPGAKNPAERDRNLIVEHLDVKGPANFAPQDLPDSHRKIIFVTPDKSTPSRDAARKILTRLAGRAYRRPATDDEIERLLELVSLAEREGDRFEAGIQLALEAILVSPYFLFKVETPVTGDGDRLLTDYELATNLSYFLWSSMPDDELLLQARSGTLRQDDNLEIQVRRLLTDPKAHALVDNFAAQWLQLRSLDDRTPDPQLFPAFNSELGAAMQTETEMLFAAIVREDRSVFDLLGADFTFVNETLARHYGIDGVRGERFQRIALGGTGRGGVLTHASILTLTSNPTRTSPVKRGKWVLENLLGTPPPPPLPDAMMLEQQSELKGTLRQRMEQHRRDPRCASCHQQMDPLGFALENFDAIGKWRDREEGQPIDASGELPDGTKFRGAQELQQLLLLTKHDEFVHCLTERLLTYALGRGLEYYDQCAVDKITTALAENDYRFSTLVLEIVRSDPFQKRRMQRSL